MKKPLATILYGDPGVGKTTAAIRAFPDAVCFGLPETFECVRKFGLDPEVVEVGSLEELADKVRGYRGRRVIFDDLTLLSQESQYLASQSKNGWELWGYLGNALYGVIRTTKTLDLTTVVTMHPTPPRAGEASVLQGGPAMPTTSQKESLYRHFGNILRMTGSGASSRFHAQFDDMWNQKAREETLRCAEEVPGNLRAALIVAGCDVGPRKADIDEVMGIFLEYPEASKEDARSAFPRLTKYEVEWAWEDARDIGRYRALSEGLYTSIEAMEREAKKAGKSPLKSKRK